MYGANVFIPYPRCVDQQRDGVRVMADGGYPGRSVGGRALSRDSETGSTLLGRKGNLGNVHK
jgi:hypothetical protein